MIIWKEGKPPKPHRSSKVSGFASWGSIMSEGASADDRDAVSKGLEPDKSAIEKLEGKDAVNYLAGAITAITNSMSARGKEVPALGKALGKVRKLTSELYADANEG
ncbi:hypothetical protein FACS1894200_12030 [Spirochaetia bacterium]|nr:hypothetical protein FACS1894200_12030 [Spirochaetia bacterium]